MSPHACQSARTNINSDGSESTSRQTVVKCEFDRRYLKFEAIYVEENPVRQVHLILRYESPTS